MQTAIILVLVASVACSPASQVDPDPSCPVEGCADDKMYLLQRTFEVRPHEVKTTLEITIDSSSKANKKCVDVSKTAAAAAAAAGAAVKCDSDAGNKGKRLNNDTEGDEFQITSDEKEICARRINSNVVGWDMGLKIQCHVMLATCSAFICPTGYSEKDEKDSITCAGSTCSEGECCDETCGGYPCPNFYSLKPSADTIDKGGRDICCDKVETTLEVMIDSSNKANKKCVDVSETVAAATAATGATVECDSDAGNKGKRLNSDTEGDEFQITSDEKEICARRINFNGGWSMGLKIRCQVMLAVVIGDNGKSNKKCVDVSTPVECDGDAGDKGKRLNSDTEGDKFQITSDEKQVCARRKNDSGGWGMGLKVQCRVK